MLIVIIILRANVTRDPGLPCLGAMGASVWGIGLAGCQFLCAGKYTALLIQHERGGPQHPAHEGVKSPGILFMTLASARGHEWLATCVPVEDVLSQGILSSTRPYDLSHFRVFGRESCMLPPIGGNY